MVKVVGMCALRNKNTKTGRRNEEKCAKQADKSWGTLDAMSANLRGPKRRQPTDAP